MRVLLALAILVAAVPARAAELIPGSPVEPLLLLDTDLRLHPNEVEGENGFSLGRLRLGLRASPVRWFYAYANAEFIGGEGPHVFEAFFEVRPNAAWSIGAGYRRSPLFHTARDELLEALPVPELSAPVKAFWPGADLGVEVHHLPTWWPVEAWLRVSNGAGEAAGNDNDHLALEARVDGVWGRARGRAGDGSSFWGFRLGMGGLLKDETDAPGISGITEGGYTFYRAAPVTGWRRQGEAHAALWAGPVMATAEVGEAIEDRSHPGPSTDAPRVPLDAVTTRGGALEVAWMLTGPWRQAGAWPNAGSFTDPPGLAGLEVAARLERLVLGLGARDVHPNGVTAEALAVRWWATGYLALAVAAYHDHYDQGPLEEPDTRESWMGLVRATVSLR